MTSGFCAPQRSAFWAAGHYHVTASSAASCHCSDPAAVGQWRSDRFSGDCIPDLRGSVGRARDDYDSPTGMADSDRVFRLTVALRPRPNLLTSRRIPKSDLAVAAAGDSYVSVADPPDGQSWPRAAKQHPGSAGVPADRQRCEFSRPQGPGTLAYRLINCGWAW